MVQWRHPTVGLCELGHEPSNFVEGQEFGVQLRDSQLRS
jgi:hypothetical protein